MPFHSCGASDSWILAAYNIVYCIIILGSRKIWSPCLPRGLYEGRLGIDNEFKTSVFMGNDNPFAILWTLTGTRLFARDDGRTSLIGFNLSNSADNETLRQASYLRRALG